MDKNDLSYRYTYGDGVWHEGVYTYSYEDWLEGKISPEDVLPLSENRELSHDAAWRIRASQSLAYLIMIKDELFQRSIMTFFNSYQLSFMKKEILYEEIEKVKSEILQFKKTYPKLYENALRGKDERTQLTSDQVQKALIYDQGGTVTSVESELLYPDTSFEVIVKAKYLHWLLWLCNVNTEDVHERSFQKVAFEYCLSIVEEEEKWFRRELHELSLKPEDRKILDEATSKHNRTLYTFSNLFILPEQANKILKLIEEHLSSTGQWLTEPKGRYLAALYTELQSKGYLKQGLSAPIIAVSFRTQFDVQLSSKIYQPQERIKAEDYRQYFESIIPPNKP